jgi:hypothetical protein
VALVLEGDLGRLQPAVALDVHLIVPVHQDVGNRGVREQDLERAEAEQLVQHVVDDALALVEAERRLVAFALEQPADQRADLWLGILAPGPGQAFEVEPVEQVLMDPALELLVRDVARVGRECRADLLRSEILSLSNGQRGGAHGVEPSSFTCGLSPG